MAEKLAGGQRWWPFLALIGFLACFFGALAPAFINRYRISFPSAAGIYCCFLLLLILMVAPGIRDTRRWIEGQTLQRSKRAILPLIWCLPYLAYAAGTRDLRWTALARLLAVSAPLFLIYVSFPVLDPFRFAWQDLAVAIWLIAAVLSHQLVGIWNVPANLDFMSRLFLIAVASWCWVFVRRVPELGYDFSFSAKSFAAAAQNFALFSLIAIPSSLAVHFTEWNPRGRSFVAFCVDYVEIFLFIALLEELFFRGFLQTLISNSLRSVNKGQAIVSCLFGLFHVLHAPFPNWRYVALATVAGWFYGSAFLKSGSLIGSSLTHAMVDTVWRTFFTKS